MVRSQPCETGFPLRIRPVIHNLCLQRSVSRIRSGHAGRNRGVECHVHHYQHRQKRGRRVFAGLSHATCRGGSTIQAASGLSQSRSDARRERTGDSHHQLSRIQPPSHLLGARERCACDGLGKGQLENGVRRLHRSRWHFLCGYATRADDQPFPRTHPGTAARTAGRSARFTAGHTTGGTARIDSTACSGQRQRDARCLCATHASEPAGRVDGASHGTQGSASHPAYRPPLTRPASGCRADR
jgi:hypothetical protein